MAARINKHHEIQYSTSTLFRGSHCANLNVSCCHINATITSDSLFVAYTSKDLVCISYLDLGTPKWHLDFM